MDANGHEPYSDWLENLKDQKAKEIVRVRIRRLESGLYGDCESVGDGVFELRIFFGPGYRVYFGEDEGQLVILLDGGDKGFELGISASQYQKVAKVSKATASRHLGDLLAKGCLVKLEGGGRNTRYQINTF